MGRWSILESIAVLVPVPGWQRWQPPARSQRPAPAPAHHRQQRWRSGPCPALSDPAPTPLFCLTPVRSKYLGVSEMQQGPSRVHLQVTRFPNINCPNLFLAWVQAHRACHHWLFYHNLGALLLGPGPCPGAFSTRQRCTQLEHSHLCLLREAWWEGTTVKPLWSSYHWYTTINWLGRTSIRLNWLLFVKTTKIF